MSKVNKSTAQRVIMTTSLGDAEAIKEGKGKPWKVSYPWGSDQFFGTRPQVIALMRDSRNRNDPDRKHK